jgi:hypothetical protein
MDRGRSHVIDVYLDSFDLAGLTVNISPFFGVGGPGDKYILDAHGTPPL